MKIWLFFFVYTVAYFSTAQKDVKFKNYTINHGLSQSSVTTIIQDNLNSLWIGTQDGLNRYDGSGFEVFSSDNTDGLISSYILSSFSNDPNILWFGTNKGLTKYNIRLNTFKSFEYKKGKKLRVVEIDAGEDGKLWLSTPESGVLSFDTKTNKFTPYGSFLSIKEVLSICQLNKHEFLVSSSEGELYRVNFEKKTKSSVSVKEMYGVTINRIKKVFDQVYVLTSNGVYQYKNATNTLVKALPKFWEKHPKVDITDIEYQNETGWILASGKTGLYIHGEETFHYTADIFQTHELNFDELNCLFRDQSGLFWAGTNRGLSSFDPTNKGIFGAGPSANENQGIPSPSVWSFTENEDGSKVFIANGSGVSQLNTVTGNYRQFFRGGEKNLSKKTILCLKYIDSTRIFVGYEDGLFLLEFSEENYSLEPIGQGTSMLREKIYIIEHWRKDEYWIATKTGAMTFDFSTRKAESYTHNPKNPENSITKGICRFVYKDNQGDVWLATNVGGLNKVHIEDDEVIIRPEKMNPEITNITTDYISSVAEDGSIFWLGTLGGGLIKWDRSTNNLSVINKSKGLVNDVIYGVLQDQNGGLWMSTNKGVCNYVPQTKSIKNYTEEDGLMSNECNLGAHLKSANGNFYFGGIYGFNYFNPLTLNKEEKRVSVLFTRFKLEKGWLTHEDENSPLTAPIFEVDELHLNYYQRSFTIAFQPTDLSRPSRVNYKYILEGADEGEVFLNKNNQIHFNALAPGEYELKVYARIGNDKWKENSTSIAIIIALPFWRTWWFISILVGLALITFRIWYKRKEEQSHREQIRLEVKIVERTKEIQAQNRKIEEQKVKLEKERNKVVRQQKELQAEKEKTEKLLKNVIPESVANVLKGGKSEARSYKKVSVLFTDFVGFTKISDSMDPTLLVKKLDVFFTKFDEIILRNNLEKIKTIGDAYMCAGGVPVRNKRNPIDACLAALQIQDYVQKCKFEAIANNEEYWELRLGINTGEVTAGVIGTQRWSYDVWGSTVNQAQRMEMMGEPGKVTITEATFIEIEPYFECEYSGKVLTKSKGEINTYQVLGIKSELSIDGEGLYPNDKFNQIVTLHHFSSINYYNAERSIMKALEKLDKGLHYHSLNHTKDVVKSVERIALSENVTDEGLFLLKSAANFHDAGFLEQYEKNESIGARMAEKQLPQFGYTPKHIETIKELIYVTEIPHKPKNKLEEIICDADLDYLGRDDFHEIADKLRLELKEKGIIDSDREWDKIQVKFLKAHKYFTKTAIKTRQKKKEQNLKEIKQRLKKDDYKD